MTDSALNQFLTRGTSTARAAFTPSSPTSSQGYIWYETDTGNTYAWTGSAWAQVNTGGGGAVTRISEVVTSGSQASVTFSSIAATYRDLEIRVRGRGTVAAVSADVVMQFNGDTGANYDYESGHAYHSTLTGGGAVAASFYYVGAISGDSAPTGAVGGGTAHILDYRGTTFHKAILSDTATKEGTAATNQGRFFNAGNWRSTSAITSVVVYLASGNWKDGSVVSLYGRS